MKSCAVGCDGCGCHLNPPCWHCINCACQYCDDPECNTVHPEEEGGAKDEDC